MVHREHAALCMRHQDFEGCIPHLAQASDTPFEDVCLWLHRVEGAGLLERPLLWRYVEAKLAAVPVTGKLSRGWLGLWLAELVLQGVAGAVLQGDREREVMMIARFKDFIRSYRYVYMLQYHWSII